MKFKRHWAIFLILMFIVSCGINADLKRTAKSRKEALDTAFAEIESARDKYTKWKKSKEYQRFARYDDHYKWAAQYDAALAEAESTRKIWKEIEQILDINKPEVEGQLKKKIEQLNSRLERVLDQYKAPNRQISMLRKLMENTDHYFNMADRQIAQMEPIPSTIQPLVDKAVEDTKRFGWDKEKDLTQRMRQLESTLSTSKEALGVAKAQRDTPKPDYAVIADNLMAIEKNNADLKPSAEHLKKLIGELNRSYTKRLTDMKYTYWITVGRNSWSTYSDYSYETVHTFAPREVDAATFEYYANQTGDIAHGLRRIRGVKSREMWMNLGINHITAEKADRKHDDGVFWIEDTDIHYYHRYLTIENDVEKASGWQKVDEDLFAANLDNLGMDIISKPYGLYESEAVREATPAGMTYVGNEKYGTWQKDSSGNSFWRFYGQYMFLNAMLGGNRYGYNDWNTWNRNYRGRRPYYGKNPDGSSRYGSSGSAVRSSPQYRSTIFAKRGGLKSAPADVRSSAGGVRGRGPGRRGK